MDDSRQAGFEVSFCAREEGEWGGKKGSVVGINSTQYKYKGSGLRGDLPFCDYVVGLNLRVRGCILDQPIISYFDREESARKFFF